MLVASDIQQTLSARARWTSTFIGQGYSSRLGVLEETVTDVNLIDIATTHDGYVFTHKFTRRQEGARSGGDWLWCIGEPGGWLSVLVQAKIINPKTGRCPYLNHRKGQQRSLLLSFARAVRALPLYVIYTYVPEYFEPAPKAAHNFSRFPAWEWGCSWITPRDVRQLASHSTTSADEVLARAVPWSAPFTTPASTDATCQGSLGHAFAAGLAHTRGWIDGGHLKPQLRSPPGEAQYRSTKERIQWESVDPRSLVQERFPKAITELLNMQSPRDSPISGISVVSAVPLASTAETRELQASARDRPARTVRKLILPGTSRHVSTRASQVELALKGASPRRRERKDRT